MPTYLDPRVLARAEALGLKARQVVEGLRVGDHKSPFKGFSVEFVQHREYVPGDDIRHIDWKGYGRSERYTIKQYEQETNFLCHLLLDGSNSMRYGRGDANKLAFAKLLAASLAYLTVRQRDTVSLRIFNTGWVAELPASSSLAHINAITHTLEGTEPRDRTRIGPLLGEVADRLGRRGIVCLISDCLEDLEPILEGLRHLRFRGHEVILFHVLHPDEVNFPLDGNIRFVGLEGAEELRTRPQLLRPAYLRVVKRYLADIQAGCDRAGVDYVKMLTNRPLEVALSEYLVRRLQMGRK
ncbi:hypothetical protein GobsT_30530 [Gemmata obscuriglobus]|uniref:DUF58 domain-containing protein n=1 Tax=Gemmata obscuriglobus TaxID=114 RepID=A0A2Z3GZ71_9BACT|nr:DUF58 domain-containing protein [Gemmata obscuriglobus]AWM38748.1 DUF58 domain-containing protein [Gemmata obscuriglobus]QEG28277.1 hypothetical protein GobsT_30530 [Gemmata obscuriglobus]VTS06089.1 Uncharacterized protein OS=Chthoniobacter flavus Ellin428 GN=CfE428DRAFT_2679 PE=4 SV=1: DUF58 [Gemmata obscuriglobus UQM 2246]